MAKFIKSVHQSSSSQARVKGNGRSRAFGLIYKVTDLLPKLRDLAVNTFLTRIGINIVADNHSLIM